jgi:predicted transcriptional regulator of viral defense system
LFKYYPGVHSHKEIVDAGAYSSLIRKLVADSILEEITRGYYKLTGQDESEYSDMEDISVIIPNGVFCLFSALSFHNIGTQKAFEHHIAIPNGKWIPSYPEFNFQIYQFGEKSYKSGIEHQGRIKVYSIAKTVADCFKFRNQIGQDIALEALKDAVTNKRTTISEILDQADVCRVKKVIMPYLELL